MEINILVITLIVIIIFLSALMLYREFQQLRNENKSLRVDNKSLNIENGTLSERVRVLEESARKRMPYEAYEAMLDAMAGLDVEEREAQFHSNIRENIRAHIYRAMTIGTNREGEK